MVYGIQYKNDNGKTIIYESMRNVGFIEKFSGTIGSNSLSMTAGGYNTRGVILDTSITSSNALDRPIVFYVPAGSGKSYCYGVRRVFYDSGRWKIQVVGDYRESYSYEIYVFGRKTPPSGGWGLEIRDPDSGDPVFSTRLRPLGVLDIGSASRASDSLNHNQYSTIADLGHDTNIPINNPGGDKIAVLANPWFSGVRATTFILNESGPSDTWDAYMLYSLGAIKSVSDTQLRTFVAEIGQVYHFYGIAAVPTDSPDVPPHSSIWDSAQIPIINAEMYD